MDTIFKISKVDIIESKNIIEHYNKPHKHEYEELLIGRYGQLEHFIDFKTEKIEAPFVIFISQGKIHKIRPLTQHEKCEVWCIRFKREFIPASIYQLYSIYHEQANISLKTNDFFDRLITLCELIHQEYIQISPALSVIQQLLLSIFAIIESERKKLNLNNTESRRIQSNTFKNFLNLIEKNYKNAKDVNFYADKLFMTARNLNLICREILRQSVSEIIETRKLTEAKNLLVSSEQTVSEIAYSLGFTEKTYFTHTFKKKTGLTPTEYRKEMTRLIS